MSPGPASSPAPKALKPPDLAGLSGRHVCDCGKSFARKEHLNRHRATHDQQQAHTCPVCQRRFSRKELLRRHSAVHDPSHVRSVVSCDACRANKTKCSGGEQCSLCARRGIRCTFEDAPHRSILASTKDKVSKDVNEAMDEDDTDDPIVPGGSGLGQVLPAQPRQRGRELLQHEVFQHISFAPSRPIQMGILQTLSPGLKGIEELLLSEVDSLEGLIPQSGDRREWLAKTVESYFRRTHLHWPIHNEPSFDARTANLFLSASVCVLGVWLGDQPDPGEKRHALRLHDLLLQQLLHRTIGLDPTSEDHPWPLELFQAILLALTFSLYRTDQRSIARAQILLSTFMTHLRQIQAFNAQILAKHLTLHFSGRFEPYIIANREHFKRLLSLTYQLDTFMSLAHGHPPMLHLREMDIPLTATYAAWNAHGLDIFTRRLREEPAGRDRTTVSALMSVPSSLPSSPILIEDIILGLCGTYQTIRGLQAPLRTKSQLQARSDILQNTRLTERLDEWKRELDKMRLLCRSGTSSSDARSSMLLAYRGEDDSSAAASERITSLAADAMVLHHLLKMQQHAAVAGYSSSPPDMKRSRSKEVQGITRRDREAMGCVLRMLGLADSISASPKAPNVNPLVRQALIKGEAYTIRFLVGSDGCQCSTDEHRQGSAPGTSDDIEQWIKSGGMLCSDGVALCLCKLDVWAGRFEKAIQEASTLMESTG